MFLSIFERTVLDRAYNQPYVIYIFFQQAFPHVACFFSGLVGDIITAKHTETIDPCTEAAATLTRFVGQGSFLTGHDSSRILVIFFD